MVAMTRILIRVDGTVSDELASAFPQLSPRAQRAETTLVGDVTDQEELQGVLNLLQLPGDHRRGGPHHPHGLTAADAGGAVRHRPL